MNMIQNAYAIAEAAHKGQKRKYTGGPYFQHCVNVANQLHGKFDYEMISAAYLHDTIEDTDTSASVIIDACGINVFNIVIELTNEYNARTYPELNRAQRKRLEAHRLSLISPRAQTIKYADLIDNTSSIIEHDKDFAKVYLAEKRVILTAMDKGHPDLYYQAWKTLINAEQQL